MTVTLREMIQIGKRKFSREEIVNDYRLAFRSREASVLGRKEVMSGRAKFGIFGDGKEVAQIAMAKAFRKGDFRSGYYRDQTFMFATGMASIAEFFAQLYAHPDETADPASAGRGMSCHFATRSLHPDGSWKDLVNRYNSTSDVSPTGSQMPRLVGLGYASKLFREVKALGSFRNFSIHGDEVAFGTIGNAGCAEGMFWEAVNAIGVLKIPVVLSIWDDEYGISVPNEYQLTKENLFELLSGFRYDEHSRKGFNIYQVLGWDFPLLVATYLEACAKARRHHVPAIIHVRELTQPLGHSTSGSHERYKTRERLQWEREFDCNRKMREWMIAERISTTEELDELEQKDREQVKKIRDRAWEAYRTPILAEATAVAALVDELIQQSNHTPELKKIRQRLTPPRLPLRRDIHSGINEVLLVTRGEDLPAKQRLIAWKKEAQAQNQLRFSSHLYSESEQSATRVESIPALYSPDAPVVNGFEVLNACFDAMLKRDPRVIAFGEDVGKLGAVNQGFRGLQEKYGEWRVSDTGIRECTIIGQAIGMAMRGLRPIAEIQYLDYLLYAVQILSDDLATLHWRTRGGQKAPVIIRTRGHRLEGVWHSGSPMAGLLNLLRGVHILVPRNMTQAAGFYNTLLLCDEPGLVVEVLNGYRLKEKLPSNIDRFTVPVGVPEVIRPGQDLTLVTYGACCRIALAAAEKLHSIDIDVEVIDVQTLLPFDLQHRLLDSLKKTNRILFLDEDVPGGTTAYMMQQVLEEQDGYHWLDAPPQTLSAKPHRPSYGSDGDYFSKPNVEQVVEIVTRIMHEADPVRYPLFYEE